MHNAPLPMSVQFCTKPSGLAAALRQLDVRLVSADAVLQTKGRLKAALGQIVQIRVNCIHRVDGPFNGQWRKRDCVSAEIVKGQRMRGASEMTPVFREAVEQVRMECAVPRARGKRPNHTGRVLHDVAQRADRDIQIGRLRSRLRRRRRHDGDRRVRLRNVSALGGRIRFGIRDRDGRGRRSVVDSLSEPFDRIRERLRRAPRDRQSRNQSRATKKRSLDHGFTSHDCLIKLGVLHSSRTCVNYCAYGYKTVFDSEPA